MKNLEKESKCWVSADWVLAFSEVRRRCPEFWLNIQRNWDLWHVR